MVALVVITSRHGSRLLQNLQHDADSTTRTAYMSRFFDAYEWFWGISLVMPFVCGVLAAIWCVRRRDDWSALTYLLMVLHRLRLVVAIMVILALLTPEAIMVNVYWAEQSPIESGSASIFGGFYLQVPNGIPDDYYPKNESVILRINIALLGLSLLGTSIGVWLSLLYRNLGTAIVNTLAMTGGLLVVLGVIGTCIIANLVFNFPVPETVQPLIDEGGKPSSGESMLAFFNGGTILLCILPVYGAVLAVILLTEMTTTRD